MRYLQLVLFVTIVAAMLLSCAAQKTEEQIRIDALVDEIMNSGKQVYLAHNLWYEDPEIVEAINFKDLKFKLVAGTAVENLAPMFSNDNMFIRFNVCGEKQILRLCSNFSIPDERSRGTDVQRTLDQDIHDQVVR